MQLIKENSNLVSSTREPQNKNEMQSLRKQTMRSLARHRSWNAATSSLLLASIKCILFAALLASNAFTIAESMQNNSVDNFDDRINAMLKMFGAGEGKRLPQGLRIVEGDIAEESNELQHRKAVNERQYRWPSAIVPYVFHSSITTEERTVIEAAMKEWHKETCLRFKPRMNTAEPLFLRIRSDQDGCWSLLGRQLSKYAVGQDLSIGKGCASHAVVVHELGHAIGFHHEQSRFDRDSSIHINYQNVEYENSIQFDRENDLNFGVPYDITSVMQYPSWAFSKDVFVKQTIVTQNPKYQRLLGKASGLTFRDKKTANLLYNCNKDCPNKENCLNEGYLSPYRYDGKSCVCVCPPTATGKRCETIINDNYYDAIEALPCGGNVTEEGYIQTPDYPRRTRPYQSCAWIITAPRNKVVRATFEGFSFAPRAVKPGTRLHGKCYDESVELRLNDRYNGQLFCGTDIAEGAVFTSRASNAIIIVVADQSMTGKGLKAKIQFADKRRNFASEHDTHSMASDW